MPSSPRWGSTAALRAALAVYLAVAWGAVVVATPSLAQPSAAPERGGLGGPSSAPAQLERDEDALQQPGPALRRIPLRKRLEEGCGLVLGADYNALYQHASNSPGEDHAASGVARIYGHWTPFNRGAAGASMLVFKGEHRHRLGTSIAPQALGPTSGYAGLTAIGFSDAGALVTNLYWRQAFAESQFAFVAGIVDVTDYLDVYGLVNPWTDFNNLAFSTSPTIPAPNQGLGAAALWSVTRSFYIMGGVADANGDPGDPAGAFGSFFGDREYFKHVEVGWIGSWEKRFSDNIHVGAWHVDGRDEAGVESGWGVTVSLNRMFAERVLPFLRAGYSDGGGALLERSVSAGVGYRVNERKDYIGIGASWGRTPSDASGERRADQYSFEAYYRIQLLPQVAVTPDVQFIVDPGLDPDRDELWVLGIRLRAAF